MTQPEITYERVESPVTAHGGLLFMLTTSLIDTLTIVDLTAAEPQDNLGIMVAHRWAMRTTLMGNETGMAAVVWELANAIAYCVEVEGVEFTPHEAANSCDCPIDHHQQAQLFNQFVQAGIEHDNRQCLKVFTSAVTASAERIPEEPINQHRAALYADWVIRIAMAVTARRTDTDVRVADLPPM